MRGGPAPGAQVRAFLALEIPGEVKEALGRGLGALRPRLEPARWVRVEGLHLTVKFLGETPPGRLDELQGALAGPLSSLPPVEVALAGAGFFPGPARPRVAWIGGTARNVEPLVETVERVTAGLGWTRERRPWALHLTVARLRSPWSRSSVEGFLAWGGKFRAAPFTCRELVLFSSELRPGGAVYAALARLPLGEEAA